MKTKKVLLAIAITALIVAILLISLKAYYVAIALVAGILILGHRELWSLLRRRRLPAIDERVRENVGKSVRNGFIFLVVALAFLMLPFTVRLTEAPSTLNVLIGLFLAAGAVYLVSYLFYDQAGPKLGERGLKMLKIFLRITGISLCAFIVSVFLHNAIHALFIQFFGGDFWERTGLGEEPVFFFVALLSIVTLAVGLVGTVVIFIKGLFSRAS